MILRIFDVSEYIYAGPRSVEVSRLIEDSGPYRVESIPVGGVKFILRTIKQFWTEDTTLVYCCDRIPTYKRKLFELWFPYRGGYKGNRKAKDEGIIMQQSMAEDILNSIGVNVLFAEGYEADDLIANVVEHYSCDYDKVYIHARDSDLFYLVRDNVEIMPVGNMGKHITMQNWEQSVSRDYQVMYNTRTYLRMMQGGKDNVPKISKMDLDNLTAAMKCEDYHLYGDMGVFEELVLKACGKGEAWRIFRLICPWKLELEDFELYEYDVDFDKYKNFSMLLDGKESDIKECNALIEDYLDRFGRR